MLRTFASSSLSVLLILVLAACGGGGSSAPASTNALTTQSPNQASSGVVLGGTVNPANSIGQNGDYYLNVTTSRVFGPKVNDTWPAASLQLSGPNGTVTLPSGTGTTGGATGSGGSVVIGSVGGTGATGATGTSSLTVVSPEPVGSSFCPTGGSKIIAGADSNANGTLDPAEVTSTAYACNGTNGGNGTNGSTGVDGNSLLNGSGAPLNNGVGIDGDFYLDTVGRQIYGPKINGVWPANGFSLVGPVGAPGATGATGATGAAGAAGAAGAPGASLLSGSGVPSNAIGGANDFYINTASNSLIGPKTIAGWPTVGISLTGATGAMGATGPAGPVGPAGAAGAAGLNGASILAGPSAPSSTLGNNGDLYFNTSTGTILGPKALGIWPATGTVLVGATGPQGLPGAAGATGPQGLTGLTGATGPAGVDGKTIRSGSVLPAASLGNDGDFYIDTTSSTLYGPKALGVWPAGIPLIGATGAAGATGSAGTNGNTLLNGIIPPVSTVGNNGDFYLDTVAHQIYGPKAAGAWPSGVSLAGVPGPIGLTGATGAVGPTGPQGAQGITGSLILSGAVDPTPTFLIPGSRPGDYYLNTVTHTLFGPMAASAPYWPAGLSLNGNNGTNGTNGSNGNTIWSFPSAPTPTFGAVGDFYINTTTTTLFGPKTTTTAWPGTGVSLVGPTPSADVLVTACSATGNTNINITTSTTVRFIFCDYGNTPSAGTITLTLLSASQYPAGTVITVTTTNTGGAFGGGPLTLRLISPGSTLSSSNGANLALPANIDDFGILGIYPEPRSFKLVSSGSTNRWFLL